MQTPKEVSPQRSVQVSDRKTGLGARVICTGGRWGAGRPRLVTPSLTRTELCGLPSLSGSALRGLLIAASSLPPCKAPKKQARYCVIFYFQAKDAVGL